MQVCRSTSRPETQVGPKGNGEHWALIHAKGIEHPRFQAGWAWWTWAVVGSGESKNLRLGALQSDHLRTEGFWWRSKAASSLFGVQAYSKPPWEKS